MKNKGIKIGSKISNLCHDRTKSGISDLNSSPEAAVKIWYNLNCRIFHFVFGKIIDKLYLKRKYI